MRESLPGRDALVAEAKANALYLFVYLPVALSVFAALGAGLPYLLFGVLPSAALRGAQIIAWGAYILLCLLVAMTIASIVWLRTVRGTISANQAEKIMMPMGSDPIGRWLVARHLSVGKQGGTHDG
jgi:hypothetical protein